MSSRSELLRRRHLEKPQENSQEADDHLFHRRRTYFERDPKDHINIIEFISISETYSETKAKQRIRELKENMTVQIHVFSPQTDVFWKQLKHVKTLKELEVKINFQKDDFTGISAFLQESSLQHLSLMEITEPNLKQKDSNEKVEEKDLTLNVKEAFFEYLSGNSSLLYLKIQNIMLNKNDLKGLQRFIIKNSKLEELYLINNFIDDLTPLYDEMTFQSSLKKIDLSANICKFDYKFFKYHKNLTQYIFNNKNPLILEDHFSKLPKDEYYRLKDFSFHFKYHDVSIKDYPFKKLELNESSFGFQLLIPNKINYNVSKIDTSVTTKPLSRAELLRKKALNRDKILKADLIEHINEIKHLEKIFINYSLLQAPEMLLLWEGIEKNHSLRNFHLTNSTNSIESMKQLVQSLKGKKIQNLSLHLLREGTIKPIIDLLESFKYLKKLTLDNCDIIDQDIVVISKMLSCDSNMKHLNLNSNLITGEGIKPLFEAIEFNLRLEKLELENNDLSKIEGINKMLKTNKTLKYLSLKDTSLSNKDLLSVFEGLMSNQGLETILLDFKNNNESIDQLPYYLSYNHTLKIFDISPKENGPYLKSILTRNIELTKIYKFIMERDLYFIFQ